LLYFEESVIVVMTDRFVRVQEHIRKSSSDRLRTLLARRGVRAGEVTQMSRKELKLTVAQIETTEQEDAQRDGGAVFLDDDVENGATEQEAANRMTGEDDNVRVMWQFKLELRTIELDAQREMQIELARIEADKEVRIAESDGAS